MLRHGLFVYPYRQDLKRGRFFPPLGLEIVAAAAAPYLEDFDIIDLRHETGETPDFLRPTTDLVAFSVNWDRDEEFVRRQLGSIRPGPLVIAGGRRATEDPELWLRDCPRLDLVVRGDGEEAIAALLSGRPPAEVPGVSLRREGGVFHAPMPAAPPPGTIYPDRRRRRYPYSIDLHGVDTGLRIDLVAGSRGCPWNCRFCSFSRNPWGGKRPWTARSPASILEELSGIEAEIVLFVDDIFTHDMDRVAELCRIIRARGLRQRYVVNARLEAAERPEVLAEMERSGFAALLLGIESAQDRTLQAMGKGFDTAKAKARCAVLAKTSLLLHAYFILGNLGESEEEILAIAPFARELGVDTLGLSPLRSVPYDGLAELVARTPGYRLDAEGRIDSEAIPRRRLNELRRLIWRRFYTPGHVLRLVGKGFRGGWIGLRLCGRLAVWSCRLVAKWLVGERPS